MNVKGVVMKRWMLAGMAFAALTLFAASAGAHSTQQVGFVAQPVTGSIQQPTPSSYHFAGTAVWTGVVDGEPVTALYRCSADGPVSGSLTAAASFGGDFGCWAEASLGAPDLFVTEVQGSLNLSKVSLTGLLAHGEAMVCEGTISPVAFGAFHDTALTCTID